MEDARCLKVNEPFDQPLYNSVLNIENEIKKPKKKGKGTTAYRSEDRTCLLTGWRNLLCKAESDWLMCGFQANGIERTDNSDLLCRLQRSSSLALLSSEVWHGAVWYKFRDVSEKPTASVCTVWQEGINYTKQVPKKGRNWSVWRCPLCEDHRSALVHVEMRIRIKKKRYRF